MTTVQADDLADYLRRYYKKRRIGDFETLLAAYQKQLNLNGFVCTSHHDNVTGNAIAWFPESDRH